MAYQMTIECGPLLCQAELRVLPSRSKASNCHIHAIFPVQPLIHVMLQCCDCSFHAGCGSINVSARYQMAETGPSMCTSVLCSLHQECNIDTAHAAYVRAGAGSAATPAEDRRPQSPYLYPDDQDAGRPGSLPEPACLHIPAPGWLYQARAAPG